MLAKDVLIGNLKQAINDLQLEKSREATEKCSLEAKIEKLSNEVSALRESNVALKETLKESDKKANQLRTRLDNVETDNKESLTRMKNREKEEFALKTEISELKLKNTDLQGEIDEKAKQLAVREGKLEKLTQKVRELENNLGENYKEKEKLKTFEEKVGVLKKRMENLQHLYYGIIPQIQCPFGHELNNPVTIIPCGHNYCLGCKKGYHKECMQCNGKLKIEAVYRNELMDDIIGIVGGIKQIIEILK